MIGDRFINLSGLKGQKVKSLGWKAPEGVVTKENVVGEGLRLVSYLKLKA